MPRALGERFLARCDEVELAEDDRLAVEGHEALEVAVIGREGVDGAMLAFGSTLSAMSSVVLVGERAWRIGLSRFRTEFDANAVLRRLVEHAVMGLFAHAVPCTRFHSQPSRLALWLLRAQDRVAAPALRFTHPQPAGLLGVQRSAVTHRWPLQDPRPPSTSKAHAVASPSSSKPRNGTSMAA